MKTASWVIIDKETGEAILETFNESFVKNLKDQYKAVPILEYLQNLNKELKNSKY